jgi:hypothetical protein
MAWTPDPMKSIAPAAATEQKIDRIVLSNGMKNEICRYLIREWWRG